MTHRIQWEKISRRESELIGKIANRGIAMTKKMGGPDLEKLDVVMDLSAAHINNPLCLYEFLTAMDADFAHDFFGIRRHTNRGTGKLEDCFAPRYSVPDQHVVLEGPA